MLEYFWVYRISFESVYNSMIYLFFCKFYLGYLIEQTESYNVPFYVFGVISVMSGVLLLITRLIVINKENKARQRGQDTDLQIHIIAAENPSIE